MVTILVLLVFCALVLALAAVGGRVPLWPAVFVLGLVELIQLWPR
jgi:hypothetical protein